MSFFRSKAGTQALVLIAIGGVILVAGVEQQAFERLVLFLMQYENYQLDDVMLATSVVGLMSLVYSALRVRDLSQEIDRRTAAERNVTWISTHDDITKLPNRRSLEERLNGSRDHDKFPCAVFAIKIDGFKEIRDLVGNYACDDVLKEIARRLEDIFDCNHVFKVGSSEFVSICSQTVDRDPLTFATKIGSIVAAPFIINSHAVELKFSVGYALFPGDGSTMREVVRCADVAMEAATEDPAAKVLAFEAAMLQRLRERSELERQLRHAVRVDAIIPHYQPIIDLQSGRINGFEALARWELAQGNFVPPLQFIELAEQTGLIGQLTENLFRRACSDALHWPQDVILSFNLSPTQLHDGAVGLRILKILSDVGMSPKRLEIEVTESALVQDLEGAKLILDNLRAAGIRIALDDFGTGYSSLGQLSRFSFDKIKIDRSFVSEIGDQNKNDKILRAIVGLSQGLEILTTAEGIETPKQLEGLRAMGCNNGQGYLFGKAMAAEQASLLLAINKGTCPESRQLFLVA